MSAPLALRSQAIGLAGHGLDRLWGLRRALAPLLGWLPAWGLVRVWERLSGRPPAPALPDVRRSWAPRWVRASVLGLAGLCLAAALVYRWTDKPTLQDDAYLVGAVYYAWHPQNFDLGYLRGRLLPAQQPALGLYRSDDPRVAARQIAWCTRFGINFLALDWWPGRPEQNRALSEGILKAPNLGDIRFCMFYETWNLNWDRKLGAVEFDEQTSRRLEADVLALADKFFNHPRYLRVSGRPVIFFYLTRTMRGDYGRAFRRLRRALRERGFDPFFIADEVYWQVLAARAAPAGGRLPLAEAPQMERIKLFDAITAYNMYLAGPPHHRGYAADNRFLPDVRQVFERYRRACGRRYYFVPSVIPGYSARGSRLRQHDDAVPGLWRPGAGEGSFFTHCFQQIGLPFVDPKLNMLLITSFNEWNEDTAIEPVAPAPSTRRDSSPSGRDYTQGYAYAGYGTTYLEAVRDQTAAVAGRVLDQQGEPVRGVEICAASLWGFDLACSRTDRQGYYTLSRLNLPPGRCRVGPADGRRRLLEIKPGRTRLGVEFTVQPAPGAE